METEKKTFVKVGDTHFYLSDHNTAMKTLPIKLTADEFEERYDAERDEILEIDVPEKVEPKKDLDPEGVPIDFENEAAYLQYIYSETDRKKRIAAKKVFDAKFVK